MSTPGQWPAQLPEMFVMMLCDAYESGVGHGLDNRELPNPYEPGSPAFVAYQNGAVFGRARAVQAKAAG